MKIFPLTSNKSPLMILKKMLDSGRKNTALAIAIFFILSLLAIGIWFSYPYWDDAWLILLVKERGIEEVIPSIPDRPVAALLMQGALAIGQLPFTIISLGLWTILGILSGYIFNILFPSLKEYAPLCVVLSISPVLVGIHLSIYNAVPSALFPVVLGYTGFILLHNYVTSETRKTFILLIGLLFFAAGIIVSEYAIPCALVTIVLLTQSINKTGSKQKAKVTIIALSLVIAVIYPFLGILARSNTSPVYALSNLKGTLKKLPFTFFGSIWQASIGAYIKSLGFLSELYLLNKLNLLCFLAGLLICIPLLFACTKSKSSRLSNVFFPLLALAIGILPMCLMSRVPYSGDATRFFLPLVPLSSAIFVFFLTKIINPRFWFISVLIVGLICGSSIVQLINEGISNQRISEKYSEILKPMVDESHGLVIAVIDSKMSDYELTGKISLNWSADLEKKFWALTESEVVQKIGSRGNCNNQTFDRELRLVERNVVPSKVLLINKDGSIEDYCKK